jgi:hypothetical protein
MHDLHIRHAGVPLLLLGLLTLPLLSSRGGSKPAQEPPPRPQWWFPYDIPAGRIQEFEIVVEEQIESPGRTRAARDAATFTVEVVSRKPDDGCRIRLLKAGDEPEERFSLAAMWLRGLASFNPRGLDVGRESVSMNGGMILRGPWRQGDRFTVAGFVWFFGLVTGFTHYEVDEVGDNHVALSYSFWVGGASPEVTGDGVLRFTSDAAGISEVRADWQRRHDSELRRVHLRIRRTADRPLGSG